MVLTKEEFVSAARNEARVVLHLLSKIDEAKLDYRPTPKQRSLLELVQYLSVMPTINTRIAVAETFDLEAFRSEFRAEQEAAKAMSLAQIKDAIGKQPAIIEDLVKGCSEASLRAEIERFGSKGSRGAMLVRLVLSHYAAYRMQLFLYLKSCGREELSTMNLWAGTDPAAANG